MSLRAIAANVPRVFPAFPTQQPLNKTTRCVLKHFSTSHTPPPSGKKVFTLGLGMAIGSFLTGGALFAYDQKRKLDAEACDKKKKENADNERISKYLKLLEEYPKTLGPMGDASKGEIEIITDPEKIKEIEKEKNIKTGILSETGFQTGIYDPVKFPNGTHGAYSRTLWNQALKGISGAAILPIMPDGKILMVCTYRHPLRRWCLEIPRGNANPGEQLNALIKRELKEETGAEITKAEDLGRFNADSGLTAGEVHIKKVTISRFGSTNRDPAETSMTLHTFTKEELKEAIRKGYAEIKINGEMQKVEIGTDSFTLAALALDEIRGSAKSGE